MDFVTNLHDSGAIVGNSLLAILIDHEQITAVRTEGGLYRGLDCETGIDVGDDLSLALGSVGAWGKKSRVSQKDGRATAHGNIIDGARCLDCVWFCVWKRAVG